jgi:ligand-binding SRPBCC domain-containing protein
MSERFRQHFTTEQWLPHPLEQVFAFFADPANLPRLMPTAQQARIDGAIYVAPHPPPTPFPGSDAIIAGSGTTLTITIRPIPFLPLRLPWIAVIEDFRWLEGFCDVQTKGPFAYWRHCHTVTAQPRSGQPGTLVQDAVEYQPPLGPLGALANSLFLRRQIAATFRLRQQRTLELLAASA